MVLDGRAVAAWPASPSARSFRGQDALFYVAVASLIMPSIIVSLGIGLEFRLIDDARQGAARRRRRRRCSRTTRPPWACSPPALGAHLTWTLPFGLLIMFAVFNRFNPAYEEAARDLGATPLAELPRTWCCR